MNELLIQQYGIFLIAAGVSLVFFLLLFLVLRRQSMKKRGLRPAAQAVNEALATNQIDEPAAAPVQAPSVAMAEPDKMEESGGFKLFKRSKAKASTSVKADNVTRLQDIEQEMLAIRELFRQGEISRSVYVAETKALYETARLVQQD